MKTEENCKLLLKGNLTDSTVLNTGGTCFFDFMSPIKKKFAFNNLRKNVTELMFL